MSKYAKGVIIQYVGGTNTKGFHSGNTYRANGEYNDHVLVKTGDGSVVVKRQIADQVFKVIAPTVCPACLKGKKKPKDEWCGPCNETV